MKTLHVLIIILMVLSSIVNIQAINSVNNTNEYTNSNLKLNSSNPKVSTPMVESSPISDWKASEDKYWQEQMKNYQLTKTFGNLSQGLDLSAPQINQKLDSSADYYTDNIAINIDVQKVFYKPGEVVNFIVQTTKNMNPISVQLNIAIYNSLNNFYYQYGGYYYRDSSSVPFLSFSFSTDQDGFYYGSFTTQSEGQYAIFVSQNPINQDYYYGASAYRVITVSDIAIYSRIPYYFIPSQPINGYAIILNGSDFSPLSTANVNVSYYIYDWNTDTANIQTSWTGQTDNSGKVVFSIPTPFSSFYWGYLLITTEKDGVQSSLIRSIWSSYYYQQENGIVFVPTFDKPIYQPGETLHARVLVWNNDYLNATKSPLINQPITIQFLSPQSTLLFQFQRVTDEYGIVIFDLPLDSKLAQGTYKIIFLKDNFQQLVDIPINYYEKPAFRVNINLEQQYVPNGHSAKGTIAAQYYFGKPVTNGEVIVKLLSKDGNIKQQVSGYTDDNGIFTFSLPVKVDETEPSLDLVASVVDPVGRTVSSNTSIITVSDIYLGAWASPWTPAPTDEISVNFYAYQGLNLNRIYYSYYSWEPLVDENVTIIVKGVNGPLTTILKELTGKTNNYGYGTSKFSLTFDTVSKYQSFEVEVKLSLKDGRSSSYTTTIQYAKYFTQISFDKNNYLPGDNVNLKVDVLDLQNKSSKAYVSISVFDADYDLIYKGASNITNSASYNLKLSSYAPIGSYLVYTIITYKAQGEWGYYYDRYVYGGRNTFQVGNQEKLQISSDKDTFFAGETITIHGSLVYQPQNPIYFEISKRGLISVQSFNPLTNKFEIDLNNTDYLAPKITVLFVTILPSGIILEVYKIFQIEQKISISITSDKKIYEPGEDASITIKLLNSNNEPIDGLAVISLIDSSVYGVKEDPEWELDHFSSNDYWSTMSTSTNWRGFQPIWFYYWYWYAYPVMSYGIYYLKGGILAPATQEAGADLASANTVSINTNQITVRDNLPESMNWQPETYIPKDGYSFTTTLADTIGEWTVRVTATKGQMGAIEKYAFNTQLPFFIEMDKPATATQDDIISIKGIFYNYLGTDIQANVSISVDNAIILNKETQSVRVPDNYLTSVRWSVYLSSFGSVNITIYGQTAVGDVIYSDGLRKPLVVNANAIDENTVFSGIVTSEGTSFNLNQYAESVQNNQYLVISRGMNDVVLNSWERLVGYPYGCLEQTMSKLMPDVLILQYLQLINQTSDTIKAEIEKMIASGIARIYSMQKSDGGFGWFGDSGSNVYMTSYAIYGLNVLMKFNYTTNTIALKNALNYLIQKQYSDGHWSADYWYMDDLAFTAFTLRNIAQLNSSLTPQLESSILKAIQYIKNSWSNNPDPYTGALYLLATYGTSRYDSVFGNTILNYLNNNALSDSNQGAYWSTDDDHWKPLGGSTETTALVLQALIKIDFSQYYSLISSGVKWLLHEQSPWGWSNTKATSESLTTIIQYATLSPYSSSGEVNVSVNGVTKTAIQINDQSDIHPINISNFLTIGSNNITLTSSTNSSFIYYFSSQQLLKINPNLDFSDSISVAPNTNFEIPFNLSISSSNVALKDIKITLLNNYFANQSELSYSIPFSNSILTGSFKLFSGNKIQTESLKGIEIEYLLTSSDLSKQAPGNIKQIFGPIVIDVTNSPSNSNNANTFSSLNNINEFTKLNPKLNQVENSIGIQLSKTYSKITDIQIGDFITVKINVNALKQLSDQYLFIKDTIPTGFTLDEESLAQNTGLTSYSLTGDSLTLFISALSQNDNRLISYKIQAKSAILASIAPAASISSMYNENSKVFSESFVLGNNLLKKNLLGIIQLDLTPPAISELKYQIQNNKKINFEITATDSEGISQVTIFYKSQNWNSRDLGTTDSGKYSGAIQVSDSGEMTFYVQIQDTNGNIFETSLISLLVPAIQVETSLILGVLIITGIISASGYKYTRKRILKKKFE